ncbi:MAG TPA: glycosyltransferase family 1 protein [Candidatus Saccharimonadales bacterium]|nr:glycosyltransferase family 1 protein [Candidatus Saccharimonadales bacterium]
MRIVIDARMMALRWTGIGLYTRKLIENLQQIDRDNKYFVLLDRDQFEVWQPSSPNFSKVLAPYKVYGLSEQLFLPFKLRRLKPDLVHFLHFNAPIFYSGQRITTIHDTTLVDFDVSPGGMVGSLKYRLKQVGMRAAFNRASKAQAIITPSQATADALIKRLGHELANKITVTHEAVDLPNQEPTHLIILDPPMLLYVGNLYPYKNLGRLLEAMPVVLKSAPQTRLQIIGNTPRFIDQLKAQAKDLQIADHVEFLGFVSDQELQRYYSNASLFVFPSLSEGFGLPPFEAMAAELPVLAARATCLPEVLGDAAEFFDPTDSTDLANKVITLLNDPTKLAGLQQKGWLHLKQFSWSKMAGETRSVYNKFN